MIITHRQLADNLGDQLFQIATVVGLARMTQSDWSIPHWKYEDHFSYKFRHHKLDGDVMYLDGLCQNWRCFNRVETQAMFRIKSQVMPDYWRFCGVHVSKDLPIDYYEACISQSEGPFLVIGDDVNLNFKGKEHVVCKTKTEIDALTILRSCRKLILSNTSLAWWANYLSPNSRYCYAPIPWRKDCDWSHIYTENMSLIGV